MIKQSNINNIWITNSKQNISEDNSEVKTLYIKICVSTIESEAPEKYGYMKQVIENYKVIIGF